MSNLAAKIMEDQPDVKHLRAVSRCDLISILGTANELKLSAWVLEVSRVVADVANLSLNISSFFIKSSLLTEGGVEQFAIGAVETYWSLPPLAMFLGTEEDYRIYI